MVGPTGIGKTRAAFELALRLDQDVLVADSRQAYQRLHIATNHPPAEYRQRVNYRGIEFADPVTEVATVFDFLKQSSSSRPLSVVEGGSMLWVDALTEGFNLAGVPPNPERRADLQDVPVEELAEIVRRLDPQAELDFRNRVRLIRAIEILEASGPPLGSTRRWRRTPEFRRFGLDAPMEVIERRLRARCQEQVERGLLAETEAALAAGVPRSHPVLTGIGYRQALDCLEGRISQAELPNRMFIANRRYARRQLAWFKRHPHTTWVAAEPDPVPAILRSLETAV
ncbi:MAG TPA: hypothetical protein VF160_04715 [Candidatus Dormibacteraeota bacterium]